MLDMNKTKTSRHLRDSDRRLMGLIPYDEGSLVQGWIFLHSTQTTTRMLQPSLYRVWDV